MAKKQHFRQKYVHRPGDDYIMSEMFSFYLFSLDKYKVMKKVYF